MKTFCDNCGREEKTVKVILAGESGTAEYCADCARNNPYVKVDKGRPEYGKIYSLTGAEKDKCIMNGNTWAESEVKN